jgi:CRISPR-associated protein Cas5t
MNNLFYLESPCTSFPRSFARDYKETYLYPPPSTIYGFLLSLVGEEDLTAHLGVRLAIGFIGDIPPISRIVRKQRSHKFGKKHQQNYSSAQFSKPNFQELLTDLKLTIKIDSTEELGQIKLEDRVKIALSSPDKITRFSGLCLGESWALVNGFREYREDDGEITWLNTDSRGLIGLPIWIDRDTNRGTFQRFSLGEFKQESWVLVNNPEENKKSQSRK